MISKSNLITIIGGKWTTYRKMAEDVIDKAIQKKLVPYKQCITKSLKVHGFVNTNQNELENPFYFYGSDLSKITEIENENSLFKEKIHQNYDYTFACVIFAVRNEMALKVEDVLSRRIRLLFLDAEAAITAAPKVAQIMAEELNFSKKWIIDEIESFTKIANQYKIQTLL